MIVVGTRVRTEFGDGIVQESSTRRVFVTLDDGSTINVTTGTPGYDRIQALAGCEACDKECIYVTSSARSIWVHTDTGNYRSSEPFSHDCNTYIIQSVRP